MSVCISGQGEFSSHQPLTDDPYTCGLCGVFDEDELRRDMARVVAFIDQRPGYVAAARNTPGDVDQADYHRWQGHMEARRQLAQSLGYTVPYECGDKTRKGTS